MGIKIKLKFFNNNKTNNNNNETFIFINIISNIFTLINKLIKNEIFSNYRLFHFIAIFKVIIIGAKTDKNAINRIFIIFLKIFESYFYCYLLCDPTFE